MKDLNYYFDSYAEFHKNETNQLLHMIGVPLIMFSLFGLLARFDLPSSGVNLALILWAGANLWYFKLSPKVAVLFAPLSFGLYYLSLFSPISILWSLFVIGWIVQLWGHKKFEGRSPAFMQNAAHLLIGPLWVFVKAFRIKH